MKNTEMIKGGVVLVGTFKGFKVNEKNIQVGVGVMKETMFGDQEEIKVLSFFKDDSTIQMQAALSEKFLKDDVIALKVDYRSSTNNGKAYLNVNVLGIYTPEESQAIAKLF